MTLDVMQGRAGQATQSDCLHLADIKDNRPLIHNMLCIQVSSVQRGNPNILFKP